MKKIIRLTESDLTRIVRRVIMEQLKPNDLNAIKNAAESVFQFNKQYFETKPTGVIKLEPDQFVPRIQSINGINTTNNYTFNEFWKPNGTEFGRGFRSGDGNFTYSFDGTKINLMSDSNNTKGGCKTNNGCVYLLKNDE